MQNKEGLHPTCDGATHNYAEKELIQKSCNTMVGDTGIEPVASSV